MLRLILAYEVVRGKMTVEQAHELLKRHGDKRVPLDLDVLIKDLREMGIGIQDENITS